MSNNPYKRSSFKDRSRIPTSRSEPEAATAAVPLSVNTRVPVTSQKHVEFASPPAIPISPASYPSSPESTRQSPAFRTVLPSTPDYSEAIQFNPFSGAALADEHDLAIEQAVQNARTNSEITTAKAVQRDAVKDTLSRFASGPKRSSTNLEISTDQAKPQKQALDVDAFKRLLLTGESTAPIQQSVPSTQAVTQVVSDSSSSTASLSQRSILEGASQETPRSSIEQDRGDGDVSRPQIQGARPKPPPPKPRYGKPISETTSQRLTESNAASMPEPVPLMAELQTPTPSTDVVGEGVIGSASGLDPSDVKKRPPTPPLTRRKSSNKPAGRPNISRNTSSLYSVNSSSDDAPSPAPTTPGKMPPPPPPTRRMSSQASRKASTDLPAMEEEQDTDVASIDRLSTSSKRMSLNPPPLPPPRRVRGSSRSSSDSQRPSMAQLGMTSSPRSGGVDGRSSNAGTESRKGSGAVDILADLAALQREVDAARGQAGR